MAWTDPSTQTTGTPVTSALWNIQVVNDRDNEYNLIQYGGGSQSENVAIGAGANCTFDTDLSGYDGYRDGVNDDRVYAVKTGLHLYFAFGAFDGATNLTLKVNAAAVIDFGSMTYFSRSEMIYLTAGDYITLYSGTARTMYATSQIGLKLLSGGWTDYGHWTDI